MLFSKCAYSVDDYDAIANEAKVNAAILDKIYLKDAFQAEHSITKMTAPYQNEANLLLKQSTQELNNNNENLDITKTYSALVFVSHFRCQKKAY